MNCKVKYEIAEISFDKENTEQKKNKDVNDDINIDFLYSLKSLMI